MRSGAHDPQVVAEARACLPDDNLLLVGSDTARLVLVLSPHALNK